MKKNGLIVFIAVAIISCNTSQEATDENIRYANNENKLINVASKNKVDAPTSYDFDQNYKGCQTSSCAVGNYKESDVVSMATAKVGNITQCPVSGAIFKVKEESPVFTHDDNTFYTCCSSCGIRFSEDPDRFSKNVSINLIK